MIDLLGTPKDQSQMSRFSHYVECDDVLNGNTVPLQCLYVFALHIKIGPISMRAHAHLQPLFGFLHHKLFISLRFFEFSFAYYCKQDRMNNN